MIVLGQYLLCMPRINTRKKKHLNNQNYIHRLCSAEKAALQLGPDYINVIQAGPTISALCILFFAFYHFLSSLPFCLLYFDPSFSPEINVDKFRQRQETYDKKHNCRQLQRGKKIRGKKQKAGSKEHIVDPASRLKIVFVSF